MSTSFEERSARLRRDFKSAMLEEAKQQIFALLKSCSQQDALQGPQGRSSSLPQRETLILHLSIYWIIPFAGIIKR